MTPAEAAARGLQIPLKRFAASRGQAAGRLRLPDRPLCVGPAGESIRELLTRRLDERFFYGPAARESLNVPGLRDAFRSAQVVDMAKALGSDGIEFLGHRVCVAPGKVDWQADPRTKRAAWPHCAMDEASAISSEDADVKYVWEINRQQYLTLLGRAFWHTGDTRFARDAVALIDDWIAANPFGQGVNWCSHLEVSMRAMSWLWTMPHLLAWPGLDDRFLERWLGSLADHHRHLASNLSIYTDPTNHLLGEATGLWMLSAVFPEFPGATAHKARAMDVLAREIGRQISSDGVNREQATSYHRFVLDFLLQILALGRRIRDPLPPVLHERARAALTFVSALVGPRGDVPMIGDSDDARGIPLPELSGWDFRDLLSTGAVLFDRADWMTQAGTVAEATIWLLGHDAVERFHRLGDSRAGAPSPSSSSIFTAGGYCIFKAESPALRVDTIFDVGPLGLLPNAAHGHADALSVMIRINDELVLADPGTGTYFSDCAVRDWFRSTAAHNTLTIDDLDQADRFDVFKWVNPMRVDLVTSFTGEHVDYAVGRHDGYSRLRKAVTHWRHLLFVHPGSWIVIDYLDGDGEHLITSRYHFEAGTRVTKEPSGSFVTASAGTGTGLRFTFAEQADPNTRTTADEPASWSDRYGSWRRSPQLLIETRRSTPAALCTFIDAVVAGDRSSADAHRIVDCQVLRLPDGAALWRATNRRGDKQSILVNHHARHATRDGRPSNASFRFVRRSATEGRELMFVSAQSNGRSTGARPVCQERFSPLNAHQG